MSGGWWKGSVVGDDSKEGLFPGNYVKLEDQPVARFDLMGTPNQEGVPVDVVLMLIQPNAALERKFYPRKDSGLNFKDTSYPKVKLIVVNPNGKVELKKEG